LLGALIQATFGLAGGGRFIKFIPYPVVTGYLSGVGLIIALGQLPNLLGLPPGSDTLAGAIAPSQWQWPSMVVGGVTVLAMWAAPRFTDKVPAAIIALVAGVCAYLLLGSLAVPSLLNVHDNPLVVGPITTAVSASNWISAQTSALMELSPSDVGLVASAALTLAALLSIDTLKTCVVLDEITQRRHDSNRELIGQGVANATACVVGGMPGAGTMGPSVVNVSSGGSTRVSAIVEGLMIVLVIAALNPLVAWIPVAALAGILVAVAFRMFEWSAFRLLRHRDTRFDFLVIAAVVVVALSFGLIAASGVGVGLAILLFIRDQVRSSILRRRTDLRATSSKTYRLDEEREILDEQGGQAVVVDLQGNLFFGTTDQLFVELEHDLNTCRWMLFDMRRVQSMDYTAANLFRQMLRRLQERDGTLLFCGMPSSLPRRQDIEQYLAEVGLLTDRDLGIQVFERRDEALEWMETQVLEAAGVASLHKTARLSLDEIDLFGGLEQSALDAIARCIETRTFSKGDKIFRCGDSGDELFLICAGIVRILLPLEHGKDHHVATIGPGDYFGEMAFIDQDPRSAEAEAGTDCELIVISRREFENSTRDDPTLGNKLFERLASAVSSRLRIANTELRANEGR
jgi:SulP family sulfate permease